jgi:RNA ligase (TIGR02306 family)
MENEKMSLDQIMREIYSDTNTEVTKTKGRKLASIQRIKDIVPIEGADAIELAIVNGWKVVVAKNVGHKVGDYVVYCEIDSFLPIKEEFEFLRKTSYKKMADGKEGFRLKTIKLRGQISQGLIIPLVDALKSCNYRISDNLVNIEGNVYPAIEPDRVIITPSVLLPVREGEDLTEILEIIKYEPPIPAELAGKAKGRFPSFIPKTDEERIQNLSIEYPKWVESNRKFYVAEKLDGSSATFYYKDGEFGVCSRNLELLETEGNTFWRVAREMDLENKMKSLGYNVAFQGELVGEGIQGNPYKIKGQKVFFFNVFNIDDYRYADLTEFVNTIHGLGLDTVPKLETNFKLPDTIDELLKYAEGKSYHNPNTEKEGVVIRSEDRDISFKVISNRFLLNEK